MNRIRLLAMGTMLLFAIPMVARQTEAGGAETSDTAVQADGVPTVAGQMKLLTGRLDLTDDQRMQVKAILEKLHQASEALVRDKAISDEERMRQVGAERLKADKSMREVLNEDQKKKLDQVEQEPHPELHGNLKGTTTRN